MKKMIMLCEVILVTFGLLADPKPKADVHLRITDDLPKQSVEYNGVFSITNSGEVAFAIFTDKDWPAEMIRFYQEGDNGIEDGFRYGAKQLREDQRREIVGDYDFGIEKHAETLKMLQPGENITFERNCPFHAFPGVSSGIYKAEAYLGHDTWVPVHITPTLGTLYAIKHDSRGPAGDFYYSQEGTNQYLYVKVDDKFKRVGETKLKSTPQKEGKENTVTFVSPDGETKKLTRDQARQIVHEREQQN